MSRVARRGDQTNQLAIVIAQRHLRDRHPDLVPNNVDGLVHRLHHHSCLHHAKIFSMKFCRNISREKIENRLTDHLDDVRRAQESAVRAVVENIAPLQVFDGDVVRHGIEHRAQNSIFKCKLLRPVLTVGYCRFRAWLSGPEPALVIIHVALYNRRYFTTFLNC